MTSSIDSRTSQLASTAVACRSIPDLLAGLANGEIRTDRALVETLAGASAHHPLHSLFTAYKSVSMLAVESLTLMHAFALETRGAILEIGAYQGGGTLALAKAVQSRRALPVISVDRGGSKDSQWHKTPDIESAWYANLTTNGLADYAQLIVGNTAKTECTDAIRTALGDRMVGLLAVDADGFVWSHIAKLADRIAPDCLLVFDDYGQADGVTHKRIRTLVAVDEAVEAEAIETYAVLPWATWFGRARPRLATAFPALLAAEQARSRLEQPEDLPPEAGQPSKSGWTFRT
jgi:hypothetical protein